MKQPTKADKERLLRLAIEIERDERYLAEKYGPPEPRKNWATRVARINDAAAIRRVLAAIEAPE
jgi:hypothetical protein